MLKFYTHDKKRAVSVTPKVDVTGELILAKMYLNGVYVGLLNTVQPDPGTVTVNFVMNYGNDNDTTFTITIKGKKKYQTEWTTISSKSYSHTFDSQASAEDYEITFDPNDFHEFQASVTGIEEGVVINTITISSSYGSVDGSVLGGASNEEIAVPCDARLFEPSDDYNVVFVAEDTGVIGKSKAIVYGEDGEDVGDDAT